MKTSTCDFKFGLGYFYYHCMCDSGIIVTEFTNGPGERGSIPGWVIPKIQKWYLRPPCLTLRIIRYGSKVSEAIPGEE